MTSIRKLKMLHGAGEPDSVLARRIDVVKAAEAYVDAIGSKEALALYDKSWPAYDHALEEAKDKLETAVRRYRRALKERAAA